MLPLLATQPFAIQILDRAGNPAPCVELRTTDDQVLRSDPTGWVAFDEPGLMDERVWFHLSSDAYSVPPDFFGYEGVGLDISSGGRAEVRVDRDRAPGACNEPDHRPALLGGYTDTPFDLQIVDSVTGRGVPLVRVDGPQGAWWTDSAGHVAIREPALLGQSFAVTIPTLHGYHYAGPALSVTATEGGSQVVQVVRDNVAERLYRVTGRGVYRDSVMLGLPTPTANPVLDGRVMGQDTIMVVPYLGGWMWMFGDTDKPDYPLGLFEMSGAVANPLPDPADGVDLDYFVDRNGFSRAMSPVPGSGPTWLTGPMLVTDNGAPVTAAIYSKVNSDFSVSDRGIVVLDEANAVFEVDTSWGPVDLTTVINPPILQGADHYLKEGWRFPATIQALRDPRTWEFWTPKQPDGTDETWPDGEPRWRWRSGANAAQRTLPADDVVEHTTGTRVITHYDSVVWSPWRHRWHRIFTEQWGPTNFLGEMWYAEADTPFGPWTRATKIATHTQYTSYNPQIHVELETDGREILWQATYTSWLATDEPTPIYDYNQMMYRLDLEDPRVNLPIPVYDVGGRLATVQDLRPGDPEPVTAFLAPDRPFDGSLPVAWDGPTCDGGKLVVGAGSGGAPVFHVADPTLAAPVDAVPLWHATDGTTDGLYVTVPNGFTPDATPSGYVWPTDERLHNGVLDWLPEIRVEAGPDVCTSEPLLGEGALVAVDVSASPGTTGGAWSIALDGTEVATDAVTDVLVPAGRHVIRATWTSPMGTPYVDEIQVAVTEGPPPEDTGDTGLPGTTTHTGDPGTTPTDGTTDGGTTDTGTPTDGGGDDGGGGCGCDAAPSSASGWGAALVLAFLHRRRRHQPRTSTPTTGTV